MAYIKHWLVSDAICTDYIPQADIPVTWSDQLGYEKAHRGLFYQSKTEPVPEKIQMNRPSLNGSNWKYYYHYNDAFIDFSKFYSLLTDIRLDATTVIISDCDQQEQAILWSYAAVDVYLNGAHIYKAQPPVYKPIQKIELTLPLKKGENSLYVVVHNLGVRDTRNLFAVSLSNDALQNTLPAHPVAQRYLAAAAWLDALACENGRLHVAYPAPEPAVAILNDARISVQQAQVLDVPANVSQFMVEVSVDDVRLARTFELVEHSKAYHAAPAGDHFKAYFDLLAKKRTAPREQDICFSVYHVLARYENNTVRKEDEQLLLNDLAFIDSRGDCADFLVIGFIRLLKTHTLEASLYQKIKTTLLNFRYWMDEPGNDGMCFWSENHAIMFYGAQMILGALFADDLFANSNRTGTQQYEIGKKRVSNWLCDVEKEGIEEFNSASYMPVTIAALLNLVDFAPEDISARATLVLDHIFDMLCMHVFKQSVISPQGRVYRDVIYPHRQSVQSVLHFMDASIPYSEKESFWNICFAQTKYRFKDHLKQAMEQSVSKDYVSGNARISIQKEKDYILTSIRSPRAENDKPDWVNLCFVEGADKDSNAYVKSLNERFHGTSVFEPGVYGYQQHLWYAALSNECVVFVNHPGSMSDMDHMRPGYWYGNGVFPALKQEQNMLGLIYQIPEQHPVDFTHVFWPTVKFTQSVQDGNWLFGALEQGFVALWCNEPLVLTQDVLSNCEYRANTREMAYVCICGSTNSFASFEAFCNDCKQKNPAYQKEDARLVTEGGYALTFQRHHNQTQYI